jgi:hypothetical protein
MMRSGRNMCSRANLIATILLTLIPLCGCSRPPADDSSSSGDAQKLPFDRQPRSTGVSPSKSLIPSVTKLPEGTPIRVRLQSALSSISTHAGDSFSAVIDEPVEIDGQTLVTSGTAVTGRVLEAKPSVMAVRSSPERSSLERNSLEPGYLRIVLVSLNVGGRIVMIETSSIFAKGRLRGERNPATGMASSASWKDADKDIVLGIDRRLNFRLAQSVDLQ